jgi:HSP20 family molecular chaperone IbpA
MTEASLHTSKSQQNRWAPFSLAIVAFASYLLIAAIKTYRGMNLLERDNIHNYLRSHGHPGEFFDSPFPLDKSIAVRDIDPVVWDERLFSPLLDTFFPELQNVQQNMRFDPSFKITEDRGMVLLTTSIPDVPLEDIDIEVVGGRIIHVRGTRTTESSHLSFEKRFSIGQNVDESKLKARLTKDGVLEVSAPELSTNGKDVVRKIPVTLAEEL